MRAPAYRLPTARLTCRSTPFRDPRGEDDRERLFARIGEGRVCFDLHAHRLPSGVRPAAPPSPEVRALILGLLRVRAAERLEAEDVLRWANATSSPLSASK